MEFLRTPDEAFEGIGFDFEPHYLDVLAKDGTRLRMHYIDEGPRNGEIIFCLHGQPSWSYLYRKMVAPLTEAGFRVIAPDLIGFGKSDKPVNLEDYSYPSHVDWVDEFIEALNLTDITAVYQDWGGLIGMRLVERRPERYKRIVAANTMLMDTGDVPLEAAEALAEAYPDIPMPSADDVRTAFAEANPLAAGYWVKYASENPGFNIADVFTTITGKDDPEGIKGYEAPFPDKSYMAGPLAFPLHFPVMPAHHKELKENDRVWASLNSFTKPVLTAFSDGDPVTAGYEKSFRERLPGAVGINHVTIVGAGHFLQDEEPLQLSNAIIKFIKDTTRE